MNREDEGDRLGKLFGRYNPWSYGVKTILGAVVLAALGGWMAANARAIARKIADDEKSYMLYLVIGVVLLVIGGLLALVGLFRMGQSFEIHRKGLRFRTWFGKREMAWRDIDEIFVNKVTYVSASRGRRSYYTIRISSLDNCIRLGGGFLCAVSAIGIIQLLKLHHRREVLGDCDDIRVPENMKRKYGSSADDADLDDDRPKKKRRKARENESASTETVFDQAAQQLARGVETREVEAWLRSQGIPAPAAAAMIDKAMAATVRRQAIRLENESKQSSNDLEATARAQLAKGVKPEKVERWLREQGVRENWAAAIMQNLREERL
jgi:hypothetical protein